MNYYKYSDNNNNYNKVSIDESNYDVDENPISQIIQDDFIFDLESQVFSNEHGDISNDEQLYADLVKYVAVYRINKFNLCDTNVKTIIFMLSRVNAIEQREAIRKTWAQKLNKNTNNTKPERSVKLLFLLGLSNDTTIQEIIEEEDQEFNDILQFEFIDHYFNCTLKAIGMLRWTIFYCKTIKFIMKSDDDTIFNLDNVVKFTNDNHLAKQKMFGIVRHGWKPRRDIESKWYISDIAYPDKYYPDLICQTYFITSDCIKDLYIKSLKTLPAFKLEDVYITGILAEILNINRVNETKCLRLDMIHEEFNENIYRNGISFGHGFKYNNLYNYSYIFNQN